MDWFQLQHLASFKDDPLSQAGAQLGVWKLVKLVKGNHSAEKQVPSATHAHLVLVHTCVYAHVHSDMYSRMQKWGKRTGPYIHTRTHKVQVFKNIVYRSEISQSIHQSLHLCKT